MSANRRIRRSVLAVLVVVVAVASYLPAAEAAAGGAGVEFTVTVETDREDIEDPDLVERTDRRLAEELIGRIEQRLDAIDIKHHQVEHVGGRDVRVIVYGDDHDPETIKGVVVPNGRLEVRPVLVDSSPWLDVAQNLPEAVELYNEPGSMDPNGFFLFARSPDRLHRAIDLVSSDEHTIGVYPHEDGWRTVRLGPALATDDDVGSIELEQNPAGTPFVAAELDAAATQRIRAGARERNARQLAVRVDGEVVALLHFSDRSFSETLTIEAPENLDSRQARSDWATQVAGRIAAPIPVRVAIVEE